jgi:hypothetical protein
MKVKYANKEQSVKIVEKYLRDKIDSGELERKDYVNDSISFENEFVEYEIYPHGAEFYFRKDAVELSNELVFIFIIPENENHFIELMNILD